MFVPHGFEIKFEIKYSDKTEPLYISVDLQSLSFVRPKKKYHTHYDIITKLA